MGKNKDLLGKSPDLLESPLPDGKKKRKKRDREEDELGGEALSGEVKKKKHEKTKEKEKKDRRKDEAALDADKGLVLPKEDHEKAVGVVDVHVIDTVPDEPKEKPGTPKEDDMGLSYNPGVPAPQKTSPRPKKEGRRTGRFTAEEDMELRQLVTEWRNRENVGEENIVKLFKGGKVKGKRSGLCKFIEERMPNRDFSSIYNRLRRLYQAYYYSTGKWEEEEIQVLLKLVENHGREWIKIGNMIGRPPSSCRDKFRMEVLTNRKQGYWSESETAKLKAIMEPYANNPEMWSEPGFWPEISRKMEGQRNEWQVRAKWLKLKYQDVSLSEWTSKDTLHVFRKLLEQQPKRSCDVKWKDVAEGLPFTKRQVYNKWISWVKDYELGDMAFGRQLERLMGLPYTPVRRNLAPLPLSEEERAAIDAMKEAVAKKKGDGGSQSAVPEQSTPLPPPPPPQQQQQQQGESGTGLGLPVKSTATTSVAKQSVFHSVLLETGDPVGAGAGEGVPASLADGVMALTAPDELAHHAPHPHAALDPAAHMLGPGGA